MKLITSLNGITRNVHHRAGLDVCGGLDGSGGSHGKLVYSGIINLALLWLIALGFVSLCVRHPTTATESGIFEPNQ
jgi:hypothetical protein